MSPRRAEPPADAADWLPDFCSAPVFLSLLGLAAATLLIVQLAPSAAGQSTLDRVPLALLFVFAGASLVVGGLCTLRRHLVAHSTPVAVTATFAVVLSGTAIGSWLIYWLDHALELGATIAAGQPWHFVLGNLFVAAIAWGVALRHFYVRGQWQRQVRAHARAQFDALQARIRPHFLFNSMNTIASLVRERPDDAERVVEDLSELFRVALRAGATTTLGDELTLVRRYVDIERLRLGDRLEYHEAIDDAPLALTMPALLLQPLVENAILHGIQKIEAGGRVDLEIRALGGRLTITIRNPVPPHHTAGLHRGSGTALENIRQRLRHHFGDAAELELERAAEYHLVRLHLPVP
jgi:two-component system sensor histidine kinase AlgZ